MTCRFEGNLQRSVAVLFARRDSIYKSLSPVEVYDEDRDARSFCGTNPVIAHPPCRAWGRLRYFAKPAPFEKDLARFAVGILRTNGGVLEHPSYSSLWQDQELPRPGADYDQFCGFSIDVAQVWWGHRAEKRTWLYICGVTKREVPQLPFVLGAGSHVVSPSKWCNRPQLRKPEREATPIEFARWLISLSLTCVGARK
jgi:hypothetical protein